MTKEKNLSPYTPTRISHRTELFQKLVSLKSFRFIAYLGRYDSDSHIVRFYLPDLVSPWLPDHQTYMDWIVVECSGDEVCEKPHLKGYSICGTLTCEQLT